MGARRHFSLTLLAAVAPAFFLTACGGLTTPDLATGEVTGQLVGDVGAGAHAYVLGKPESQAAIDPQTKSFRLSGVPAGDARIVVFDGRDRAEVKVVPVRGATRERAPDVETARMPLAGRVVVVPRCDGGASGDDADLEVEGTIVRGRKKGNGGVELWPLPAGDYFVKGELKGYKGNRREVHVQSGAEQPLEVEIEIQFALGDGDDVGCRSVACPAGLTCDFDDGTCYGAGSGETCDACSLDTECGAGGRCIGGFCATASNPECESGYYRSDSSGLCFPLLYPAESMKDACIAARAAYGGACLVDSFCTAALAGGVCDRSAGSPGACTAPCATAEDCPSDFSACTGGYCAR
jgi:hypothetical protein